MPSDTPIRKQYLDVKRQYPNAIVFFRLGDFYETFDQDAEIASRELDIVLTSRNIAKNRRVPMAGIPFHSAESYIAKLIQRGYHVAICEQVGEQPTRGLFPREVVRVVTPGTVEEPGLLPGPGNNYLASVTAEGDRAGLAYADITTGEFRAIQLTGGDLASALRNELTRLSAAETLLPSRLSEAFTGLPGHVTPQPDYVFDSARGEQELQAHFQVATLAGFGLQGETLAAGAAAAILHYLNQARPAALSQLISLSTYTLDEFMTLDAATRRNLELTRTIRDGGVQGSLLGVLDLTMTPMGKRLLHQWINQPLLDRPRIEARHDGVDFFYRNGLLRADLRAALKPLADLERVTNRTVSRSATPRDLAAMRETLRALPRVLTLLEKEGWGREMPGRVNPLDACPEVLSLVETAISPEPPAVVNKPGTIRAGYSAELDGVMSASKGAREWIAGLETVERKRTGIKSLKVSFNKVFGYYLEVTKANSKDVPSDYVRKQTLVNAERYITPELKEYETLVLHAEERILEIEKRLFAELVQQIAGHAKRLLATARGLARLDVLVALAEVAAREGYVRPKLEEGEGLEVREGRHPVVEHYLPGERFVPNDVIFEPEERIRVITGPNMSGKSTYLRQAALITLLAQMGSFVPAESARIGLVDRIFTRIGAQDELHAGQSTFLVEMVETANILHHATSRSLLILDEIGRGTSTYDGISLAWAIVEFLHNHPRLRARTLFATHYHELIRLAGLLPGVRNYNVAVAEEGGTVVFLHKIVPGGADKSYGIHVAQLAGLPRPVIHRAEEVMAQLEEASERPAVGSAARDSIQTPVQQMALFPETNPILKELRGMDIASMTPLEALSKLFEWQKRFGADE